MNQLTLKSPIHNPRFKSRKQITATQHLHCIHRAVQPKIHRNPDLKLMATEIFQPATTAATIALHSAIARCNSAKLNPAHYADELTKLVTIEVREALAEMADHQAHGGPKAMIMLKEPSIQAIYFSDSGRRAAEKLLEKLNINKDGQQIH
jgi:hypothetical protein